MIKRANAEDTEILAALAIQMWTGHNLEDLAEEFRKLVMNEEAACFIKYEDDTAHSGQQCRYRDLRR